MSKETLSLWRQETLAEDGDDIQREGPAGLLYVEFSDTKQPGSLTRSCLREKTLLNIVSDNEYRDYEMNWKNPGNINWDPVL